ncbi:MAG: OmpA/MotB domain protein [Ferruginibacter sp.]|uniref:OmpA family protein n=1 Tax=Ferruginibacter sp. TaxID=1940288 RepID=UPI0026593733|nr:OmpA family protein [Ferruginibacter sp.]MDB5279966.1 OmpA/MotB domain protein [Ferruginibacter sp.]
MAITKITFKRLALVVCSLSCFVAVSKAQWYSPEKVNKKAYAIYESAYQNAMDQKYDAAIADIDKAISIDPKFVEAWLTKAGIYADQKKYDSSVINFEKALQLDSVFAKTYLLPYSISLAGMGQFQKALTAITEFLTNPTLNPQSIKAGNYRKSVYEFALEYDKKHPAKNYVFARKNLGDSVNSDALEYYPSLTIDGKKLIFTRRLSGDEDFYESDFTNGKWSKAKPLGGKVNTNLNEGAQNISQDGEWIIFTGCNYPEGQGSCDLYISFKTKNGWSEAENIGPVVNTDFWESSPSLSPDKRDLYFSSNQSGTYGGKDIWVTHRSNAGKWSRPENLGPTINTKGDESCSFMYADNQTLFFNSNGHPGYGQTDLFFSKKITDSTWSEPENLGYPINTIDEEGSLVVAADGKTAYYASDGSDTRGGLDLYSFQLREDIQPPRTLWVKGKVFDAKTKNGLPSSVELTDINTRRLISKVQTDEDGNYLTTLPVGKDYAFNVNRKGYLFFSEHYNIDASSDSVYTADIPLQPIETGASIILKNIFFDTKKTALKPASIVELDKVIQLMNDNPKLKIVITGFTDNVGKPQDNVVLSNGRALSVVNYLLASRQIARERLQFKGLGAAKPIADNSTEQGKALNRRTELSVISN